MLSVLLSVYAGETPEHLHEALHSMVVQTLMPSEIVVVKDGPLSPELEAVLASYTAQYTSLFKIVSLPFNQGLGKALNFGLKACSNEFVARMDTDDIAKPHRLERQMAVFREHPEIDICSSWIEEFDSVPEQILSVKKIPEHHDEIVRYAAHRCPVNHPTVIYKKSQVLSVGGYEGFPEDYCLWIKMLLKGYRFYNIQESLLYFRFSRETIKRRGGLKYALSDVRSQFRFYRLGFLNWHDMCYNVAVRSMVRLMPTGLRLAMYKKVIRK